MTTRGDAGARATGRAGAASCPGGRRGPFTLVVFGATGDLSRRMLLPAVFHLFQKGEFPEEVRVVGVGLERLSTEEYLRLFREAVDGSAETSTRRGGWRRFAPRVSYVGGSFAEAATFAKLRAAIACGGERCESNVVLYLAVPPAVLPLLAGQLAKHGICPDAAIKVVVEKPFGRDRSSAKKLHAALLRPFREEALYRIDHFLGKEAVQNVLFLRFANAIFERVWDHRSIEQVQITVAEEIGIGRRGSFYETTGVVRDMVQNHLLQLTALVAMEPPRTLSGEGVRDARARLFRAIRPLGGRGIDDRAVRGQYGPGRVAGKRAAGYRQERGVDARSAAPTFFAARLEIDTPRWRGVPFYVRTGKRLPRSVTRIDVQFREPQPDPVGRAFGALEKNVLSMTVSPEEAVSLRFDAKYPFSDHRTQPVAMHFAYHEAFRATPLSAYHRLLLDCLEGDPTPFVREDEVEDCWSVVDPLVRRWERRAPGDFPNYAAGTWGPAAADELLARNGHRWLLG